MGAIAKLFSPRPAPVVGIDVSTSSVKLMELSKKGEHYVIESFAAEPLPPSATTDGQIVEPDAVSRTIERCIKRSGTRTRNAAIAVSGSTVITKTIQMPSDLREQEMEEQIILEADQYVPYPIDEVNLDFQVLGPTAGSTESVDVLLAACRSETIEDRVALIEDAGLKVTIVDVEAYSLENACRLLSHQMPNNGEGTTNAIVDIGATVSEFLIIHDGRTVYRREQQFGGRQLTEDIMRHYGMSMEEANNAKKFGGLPEDYQTEVLPYFIDDLSQQIDRSLQLFFANMPKFNSIDAIILSGGSAAIEGLDAAIQSKLEIETSIAKPFEQMKMSKPNRQKQLDQDATAMLVACGLAMRAIES